mmetsp:Transcript_8799/g.26705  ORF Transcript_8799/g.26705 Transcript_8799/m.26705 type:complete len:128 (-) Transcript_8799:914-1297(-)
MRVSCRPDSITCPFSMTMIWSAFCTVERRCAMTSVVRPRMSCSSAACTSISHVESSADVASSRISSGASFRMARAMAMRCRSPPERLAPRVETSLIRWSGLPSIKLQAQASLQTCSSRLSSTSSSRP